MDVRAEAWAVRAALVVAAMAAAATAAAAVSRSAGLTLWSLIDVPIICGIAYGVYRRSRIASGAMLIYHIWNRVFFFEQTGDLAGAFGLFPIVYAFVYLTAFLAAFSHHARLANVEHRDDWSHRVHLVAIRADRRNALATSCNDRVLRCSSSECVSSWGSA